MSTKQKRRSCTNNNDPIAVQLVVGAGLRYLGEEYSKSIQDIFGIPPSSTRRIVWLLLALYWSAKLLLFNCLYCNMK
jgi:hypothetical protein